MGDITQRTLSPSVVLSLLILLIHHPIYGNADTKLRVYRVLDVSTVALADWLLAYVDEHHEALNVFRYASKRNPSIDVLVQPEHQAQFEEDMARKGYGVEVVNDDFEKPMRRERASMSRRKSVFDARRRRRESKGGIQQALHSIDLTQFNTYADITRWLATIGRHAPSVAQVFTLGRRSFEGRTIYGMRLGVNSSAAKPVIVVESGMHSREWLSITTMLQLIYSILRDYERGEEGAVTILNTYDIHLIPVTNPDGYIYTHTATASNPRPRLWRKTRSRSRGQPCTGVDPNRNWDFHWGVGERSLRNPCSSIYAGPSAFSEPEIRALVDYVNGMGDNVKMYISLHAYGQMFLGPWGYKRGQPDNHMAQKKAADVAIGAIQSTTNVTYEFGTISHMLYKAAGTSIDYFQYRGIPYVYGIELRPRVERDTSAFVQPTSVIAPTGREIYAAIRSMLEHIAVVHRL